MQINIYIYIYKRKENSTEGPSEDTTSQSSMEQREGRRLTEISNKLSLILSAIEKLTETISESYKQNSTNVEEQLKPTLNDMTQVLTRISTNVSTPVAATNTTNDSANDYAAEAMKIKNQMANLWEFKMQKRKEAFWNMIKNKGHAETYKDWIARDKKIVPRYLQKKKINNEHPDQTALRAKGALLEFQTHIELQELRYQQNIERYKAIDKEMETKLKLKSTGGIRSILIDMWKEESAFNEMISEKRWKRNKAWLAQYEEIFTQQHSSGNPFIKLTIEEHNSDEGRRNINSYNRNKSESVQRDRGSGPNNFDARNNRDNHRYQTSNENTISDWKVVDSRRKTKRAFQYSWPRQNKRQETSNHEPTITLPESDEDDHFLEESESTDTLT